LNCFGNSKYFFSHHVTDTRIQTSDNRLEKEIEV
jgi:hypothetical protein